jgi:hypothetical protein
MQYIDYMVFLSYAEGNSIMSPDDLGHMDQFFALFEQLLSGWVWVLIKWKVENRKWKVESRKRKVSTARF